MALRAGDSAPYAPPATVIDVVERYRERGLQTPITTEVLERAGVSQSLSQRTMQALRLLDFIEADGTPSTELEQLSRAPAEEWQQGLRDLLTTAYAEVWSFTDPAKDDIQRVRDAFRPFNPRGQQERMVTLFLGLCEWAGIDVSAAASSKKKAPAAESARTKPSNGRQVPAASPQRPASTKRRTRKDVPADATEGVPPSLLGLLKEIPRDGRSWTSKRRAEFLEAFAAVLSFSVPVVDSPDTEDDAEQQEVDA